ncbi:MAG: site-specific DNA-methyltransferase [Ignavibacteria bacterium]|nr:site-specific DNA-methyltransferase [Ignavibacteria bacterium]
MDSKSLDIKNEKIEKMKVLMPEVFTEGDKIDVEKLKLTFGEDVTIENERYVLNWAGKSEAFKVLQTTTTETLAPNKKESVNFDKTKNIFIEGENLEVLKILQKSYFGKIKMIEIDPPYNTGNDSFIYPDRFTETKEDYLKRIGEKDEEGFMLKEGLFRNNSKDSGHYHSNWLSMIYPRLFLARNLLRNDGVIFVHIDDNEVHNLRMVMNEIFGEENFVACFIWHSRQNVDSRSLTGSSIDHEYIICYSKSMETRIRGKEIDRSKYSNPDNDTRGAWMSSPMDGIATKDRRPNLHFNIINQESGLIYKPSPDTGWRFQKSTVEKLIQEKRILWPKNPNSKPRFKRYLNELENDYTGFSSMLDVDFTAQGTKELREIMEMETVKFPKPISVIKVLIQQGSTKDDIILDFFSGSSTTAHALYEINKEDGGNRKFILVQLPERISEDSEAFKAGYKTIADIGKERIRRVIKKINDEKKNKPKLFKDKELDLGFKVFKLKHSNFKLWRGDVIENEEELAEQVKVFENPVKGGAKEENILYELMLKSGYELTSKVEKKNGYYYVANDELVIILSKVNENILKEVIKAKPKKCICLDSLFKNNDKLKTNTVLQMKDAGVEFKTV